MKILVLFGTLNMLFSQNSNPNHNQRIENNNCYSETKFLNKEDGIQYCN